jgi:cholesterol transport system auxiliary component
MRIRLSTLRLLAVVILGPLVAGACSSLLPGQGEPPRLYVLTPKSTFPADLPKVNWQLLVEVPVSPAGLNTARIAMNDSPIELRYFDRANWTDFAPKMVQALIIESFENSHKIVGVGREQVGLRSDFQLMTDLREFQAEYANSIAEGTKVMDSNAGPPVIRVRINAKLVTFPEREIVATKTFERKIKAGANTMIEIIAAFDEALGKTLKQVVSWTLKTGDALKKADPRYQRYQEYKKRQRK